ncbi:MAG TPA: hypothetical protein VF269_00430 [Rhodanobacteraceae bacterium]
MADATSALHGLPANGLRRYAGRFVNAGGPVSNGKFASCLVGGLLACVAFGVVVGWGLSGVIGPVWSHGLGLACAATTGGALGMWLKRTGDGSMRQRSRSR